MVDRSAALAAGAAAGLSGVTTQPVKDVFTGLKVGLSVHFPRLRGYLLGLGGAARLRDQHSSLAEELIEAGAEGYAELLEQARVLRLGIEREAPEAAVR